MYRVQAELARQSIAPRWLLLLERGGHLLDAVSAGQHPHEVDV